MYSTSGPAMMLRGGDGSAVSASIFETNRTCTKVWRRLEDDCIVTALSFYFATRDVMTWPPGCIVGESSRQASKQ